MKIEHLSMQHDWYVGGSVNEPFLWKSLSFLYKLKISPLPLQREWYVSGSVNEPYLRNFHSFCTKLKIRPLPLQHNRNSDGLVKNRTCGISAVSVHLKI